MLGIKGGERFGRKSLNASKKKKAVENSNFLNFNIQED